MDEAQKAQRVFEKNLHNQAADTLTKSVILSTTEL